MQSDFLKDIDKAKRQRLNELGWRQVGGIIHGTLMWRRPESEDHGHLTEAEAFAHLDRVEKAQVQA